jgi:HlyD family secretion protein
MKTLSLKRKISWLTVAVVLAVGGWFLVKGWGKTTSIGSVFVARRGPLDINVLEGGSVQALESQEIKCEVRVGYQGIKILKIVEEGYLVSEDDVKTNKVLVELDSSELKQKIVQQDITFESTAASFVEAQQAYDIQLNQNSSDIKAAEQKAKFAEMDLNKLLGDSAANEIIAALGLSIDASLDDHLKNPKTAAEILSSQPGYAQAPGDTSGTPPSGDAGSPNLATNGAPVLANQAITAVVASTTLPATPAAPPTVAEIPPVSPAATIEPSTKPVRRAINIDYAQYAQVGRLGDGEAKQKLRKFDDDLQLAQKELGKATSDLEGTLRLFAKQFVTKTDKETSELAHENSRLKVQTAQTARDLYIKYEFPKSCEEAVSKYEEAIRELDRARKSAVSKLAQAEARLRSAQGRYNLESQQRKEIYEQLAKCTICAKKPGLVVYGGGGEDMFYYGGEERIREGATVRERQSIITIPDMTKMSVRVKIHETYIKKIKKGQKARITVDAFPDKSLEGEVAKVGVLPDSQNRWMNPDLKVYLTTINIDGTHDWIKPGMSSKVEIRVNRLDDVVYVPIQAVFPEADQQVCYLDGGRKRERITVQTGESTDEFIEIKEGIKPGDKVCLRSPGSTAPTSPTEPGKDNKTAPTPAKSDPKAPATAPAKATAASAQPS